MTILPIYSRISAILYHTYFLRIVYAMAIARWQITLQWQGFLKRRFGLRPGGSTTGRRHHICLWLFPCLSGICSTQSMPSLSRALAHPSLLLLFTPTLLLSPLWILFHISHMHSLEWMSWIMRRIWKSSSWCVQNSCLIYPRDSIPSLQSERHFDRMNSRWRDEVDTMRSLRQRWGSLVGAWFLNPIQLIHIQFICYSLTRKLP